MSKGLKELKRLPKAIKDTFKDSFNIIEKALKALEIIKNKVVDVYLLYATKTLEDYNSSLMQYNSSLTQEEYDLLKEVLL